MTPNLMRPLHVSAGRKWVSAIGLVVASAGAICSQHGEAIASLPYGKSVCLGAAIGGSLMASLGKGLADRRKAPARPPVPSE